MIQGTSSNAGKSLVALGLCRILKRRGYSVAPFKPQNMSLNSAVTEDGGEIGRAQATQALACGLTPHSDMNPLLLKPITDVGAQVIVQGKPAMTMNAKQFHQYKPEVLGRVIDSYVRLQSLYDCIVIEGAGSPAEINLRQGDIANMGFAEASEVDAPVILVADIDRGGVFAQIVGTLSLLSQSERQRVIGIIINKFRGDVSILQPGIDWLEAHTGKKVLGVLPMIEGLYIEAEDSLSTVASRASVAGQSIRIAVPRFPKISNSTDFDALSLHPQVDFSFISDGESLKGFDLIILPGSRSVSRDLDWLKNNGFDREILQHLRYGGKLLGICGGFQMLGETLFDPDGIESAFSETPCLGLLDMETKMFEEKQLKRVSGILTLDGTSFNGYEIHIGRSSGSALQNPFAILEDRHDGAISADGQIAGTYIHGVFDQPAALTSLLSWAGLNGALQSDFISLKLKNIDLVADVMEEHLALDLLLAQFARPAFRK
ncbi:MAG: cobyric acid synthase [Candidatus Melainabacteria bacterium]|nr:cobyric acid synthase [Candidatus Melainabacteria bacterium]